MLCNLTHQKDCCPMLSECRRYIGLQTNCILPNRLRKIRWKCLVRTMIWQEEPCNWRNRWPIRLKSRLMGPCRSPARHTVYQTPTGTQQDSRSLPLRQSLLLSLFPGTAFCPPPSVEPITVGCQSLKALSLSVSISLSATVSFSSALPNSATHFHHLANSTRMLMVFVKKKPIP